MSRLFLLFLIPLAACATPRQQCDRMATQDLRVIDALIAETQQNITRGYALETEVIDTPRVTFCMGHRHGHRHTGVGMVWCNDRTPVIRERPVAIDVAAEKAKLTSLKTKRPEVLRRSQRALASCAAQHPQG